jgi:hypothetical protein
MWAAWRQQIKAMYESMGYDTSSLDERYFGGAMFGDEEGSEGGGDYASEEGGLEYGEEHGSDGAPPREQGGDVSGKTAAEAPAAAGGSDVSGAGAAEPVGKGAAADDDDEEEEGELVE